MALPTDCQTCGAIYSIRTHIYGIEAKVNWPTPIVLSEEQAKLLEANIHNALELVLAPYFQA